MTISPPSNVKPENIINLPVRILASGFDRLILAADVKWNDESLFDYFAVLKAQAKANNKEVPGTLGTDEHMKWFFNMYPSGAKGWEWILKGQEFTLIIGDWLTPISRPSIMIDIASETLWRVGPRDSVGLIMHLINSIGGDIAAIKPSRVDLCMDVLMPDGLWIDELKDYRVTRARKFSPYYENERLTGMMIGRGDVSARLYDKVFEIETQSKKFWMFDIWGLENIQEGQRVILAAEPDVQDYLWTIAMTMARVSEINNLKWDDVNLEERYLVLYTRKKKGGHLTPRKIIMPDRLFSIMSRRFEKRNIKLPWVFWQRYWNTKKGEWIESSFGDRKSG